MVTAVHATGDLTYFRLVSARAKQALPLVPPGQEWNDTQAGLQSRTEEAESDSTTKAIDTK